MHPPICEALHKQKQSQGVGRPMSSQICDPDTSGGREQGKAIGHCAHKQAISSADAVLRYLLKYADVGAGEALGLARYGEVGKVIGKRAGFTQKLSLPSG